MATIIILGISGKQSPHDCCNRGRTCAEQQMKVVWNQGPGEANRLGFNQDLFQASQEGIPVYIIRKDTAPFNTSANDMV